PSGSFAKGTANSSGTDIDLFISLQPTTPSTLKEIYESLFTRMQNEGYRPKRQNVSINITVNGYDVDLVPAKRHDNSSEDHSLYRRRADTWTNTNVARPIDLISRSGRTEAIRVLQLGRHPRGLDFLSLYLELTVLDALAARQYGDLGNNLWRALQYLRDSFVASRVVDPANTNNIISDDLTVEEKRRIQATATQTLNAKSWTEVVR